MSDETYVKHLNLEIK